MHLKRNDLRNCSRGKPGRAQGNLITLLVTFRNLGGSQRHLLSCLHGLVQKWVACHPIKANKNKEKFAKGFWKKSFLVLQEGAIGTVLSHPLAVVLRKLEAWNCCCLSPLRMKPAQEESEAERVQRSAARAPCCANLSMVITGLFSVTTSLLKADCAGISTSASQRHPNWYRLKALLEFQNHRSG